MEIPNLFSNDDDHRFDKSLSELKELRAQLHFAADYCEETFSKSKQRKEVMEDTKEYICRAMVTAVDHLGNVSANLECLLSRNAEFSKASELRLNCLKQKLEACREYTQEVDLSKMRCIGSTPKHHTRYLLPSPFHKSNACLRGSVNSVFSSESLSQSKLQKYDKFSGVDLFTALPLCDGPSILSKPRIPSFQSRDKDTHEFARNEQIKKRVQKSNFMAFIRRSMTK